MATQLPAGAGASNSLFQHERVNNPKRSRFDLSRITNFTADDGMIIPFDWFPTLPGDDFDINFNMVLDTMPLINSSLTQYKVVTHWYYMKLSDLWKGSKNLITKGRSGNIFKRVPRVDLLYGFKRNAITTSNYSAGTVTYTKVPIASHSLSSFLGVPPSLNGSADANSDGSIVIASRFYQPYSLHVTSSNIISTRFKNALQTGFNQYRYPSALPFMMYQSVVKHNYVNQNLLTENKALFPDEGDDDWMLPYNAEIVNYVGYAKNSDVTRDTADPSGVYASGDSVVRLDQLRYAQFDDDYFTTGLPWLQRGEVQTLQSEVDFSNIDIESRVFDLFDSDESSTRVGLWTNESWEEARELESRSGLTSTSDGVTYSGIASVMVKQIADNLRIESNLNGTAYNTLALSANNLRELIAMSVWQERNARVDGSYNRMIYQHWHQNPHTDEHLPIYIGGSSDVIQFANIVQTSQTTDESPLGTTSGYGRAGGKSYIGRFHASDYGFIMGIMIIKPNTTYQQGVEHALSSENIFEDFVQPEFEGLSPQPILNKELYISFDDSSNDDLFAYQERYTYLKVRQNVNRGLFQCKPDKDSLFGTYTQARWFSSLPSLSYQFLVMSPANMRRDFLAYPEYPKFKIQTASEVFVTRSLSYTSEPQTFGF